MVLPLDPLPALPWVPPVPPRPPVLVPLPPIPPAVVPPSILAPAVFPAAASSSPMPHPALATNQTTATCCIRLPMAESPSS
jgi:hypothetical protein